MIPAADHAGVVAVGGGSSAQLIASLERPALYLLRDRISSLRLIDVTHAVDCYFVDQSQQTTWMGTLGSGLLRYKNGAIAHVHVKDGLYDNRIYSILRDDHANFWFASSKGVFRVAQQELEEFSDGHGKTVASIPFSTGQLRFECRSGVQPAACRTRDGRLWFSTTSGLVLIDPNRLLRNRVTPLVAITAMILDGKRLESFQNLRLKPWQTNNVEIRYAGLSFISPEKVAFRYILKGHDRNWVEAGARREAFFTNFAASPKRDCAAPPVRRLPHGVYESGCRLAMRMASGPRLLPR